MSSQHALFITQCNIGYLAAIALVALFLWNCVTTIIKFCTGTGLCPPYLTRFISCNSLVLVNKPVTNLVIKHFTALWYALKESYRPVNNPSPCKACAVAIYVT